MTTTTMMFANSFCVHVGSMMDKSEHWCCCFDQPTCIRYDSVYLARSKKLTGSQLSLPHGINKKLKCETENKLMSVIDPV